MYEYKLTKALRLLLENKITHTALASRNFTIYTKINFFRIR